MSLIIYLHQYKCTMDVVLLRHNEQELVDGIGNL